MQLREQQQLPANTGLQALAPMLALGPAHHQNFVDAAAAARWLVLALLAFHVIHRALAFHLFLQQQRRMLTIQFALGAPARIILRPVLLELGGVLAGLLLAWLLWLLVQPLLQRVFLEATQLQLQASFGHALLAALALVIAVLLCALPLLRLLHAPSLRSVLDDHALARPLFAVALQAGTALAAIALVISIAATQLPRWQQTLVASDRIHAIEVRDLETDRRIPMLGREAFAPLYAELRRVLGEPDGRWGLLSTLPGYFEPQQGSTGVAGQEPLSGALLAVASDNALQLLGVRTLLMQPELLEADHTTLLPLDTAQLLFGSAAAALGQTVFFRTAPGVGAMLKVRGIVSNTTWTQAGVPALWRSSLNEGSPRFFILVDAASLQQASEIADQLRGVVPRYFPGFDVRRVLPFAPLTNAFLSRDKQLMAVLAVIALVLTAVTLASMRSLWTMLFQQLRKELAIATALGASRMQQIAQVLERLRGPALLAAILAALLIVQGGSLSFLAPLLPLRRAWLIPVVVMLVLAVLLVLLVAFKLHREESRGIGLALREE